MKHPKLRTKKKVRLTNIRKTNQEIKEIIHAGLIDIEWYLAKDVMNYLKKRGLFNASKKNPKKNKKKKKK